ncbi:MAG: hypothetical protein V4808_05695 [Pseudomonadota bacterium]
MKIIKLLGTVAALATATAAFAELSPEYQRAAELKAILNHDDLVTAFPQSKPIEKVEYVSRDLYRVTAGTCTLAATIVGKPLPEGMVGARQFDVVLGKAECPAA